MKLEGFFICDAATTDLSGKLNILGAFDKIYTETVPAVHPMCAIAFRIRGSSNDTAEHKLDLISSNDKGHHLFPKIEITFKFSEKGNEPFPVLNFIINFQALKLEKYEEQKIKLRVDDKINASIPLRIEPLPNAIITEGQV